MISRPTATKKTHSDTKFPLPQSKTIPSSPFRVSWGQAKDARKTKVGRSWPCEVSEIISSENQWESSSSWVKAQGIKANQWSFTRGRPSPRWPWHGTHHYTLFSKPRGLACPWNDPTMGPYTSEGSQEINFKASNCEWGKSATCFHETAVTNNELPVVPRQEDLSRVPRQ